jgi:predicted methyltransferase
MNTNKYVFLTTLWVIFNITNNLHAAENTFEAVLESPTRSAADKEYDVDRKPAQVLEFLGIETGSTVMDVLTWDGWYAEVLSLAVGPEGKVIAQNSERYLKSDDYASIANLSQARAKRLNNVELFFKSIPDVGVEGKIDTAILSSRLHDAYIFGGEKVAMRFLGEIFNVLKPGGTFGVIDFVGLAGMDNKKLSRIETSTVLRLLTDTGFVIEAESNLLANLNDDHTSVINASLIGGSDNMDQMLIRARKPSVNNANTGRIPAVRTDYFTANGWTLMKYNSGDTNEFLRCSAERIYEDNSSLTIARRAGVGDLYTLVFISAKWPYAGGSKPTVSLHIDSGQQFSYQGSMIPGTKTPMFLMRLDDDSRAVLPALAAGRTLHVRSGSTEIDYDLGGSRSLIDQVKKCHAENS